jgi:Tat protein secretion system quality control protein TatD with DNase activity
MYVKYAAEEIARIKGLSFEEVAGITTQNAKQLFKL